MKNKLNWKRVLWDWTKSNQKKKKKPLLCPKSWSGIINLIFKIPMEYECTKLSNLFCPLLSTRFVMSKYTDPDKAMNDEESKDDVLMQSDDLPIGIFDCVK